jgi:hypothetical protein
MTSYRERAKSNADKSKMPQLEGQSLLKLYRELDDSEREMADRVVSEWVLSPEERLRFVALHLVRVLGIRSAVPALNELMRNLLSCTAPGAPFEIMKVEQIARQILLS